MPCSSVTIALPQKRKLVRLLNRFQGAVFAFVESEDSATCYFEANEALSQEIAASFPNAVITHEDPVDWDAQSALHSPYYHNGRIELPLPNNELLFMLPGQAFGDASHPTTRMCLKLLLPLVQDKSVLDIGTGNGVLALAAARMGATSATGVDIDRVALEVAVQNRELNSLDNVIFCSKPDEIQGSFDVIVANMTLGDAQIAFPQYRTYLANATHIVLSGLLEGQEKEVVSLLPKSHSLQQIISEDGWITCLFTFS